jgi:uncharacterized membrane protein
MIKKYHIEDDKLVVESDPTVEIPIVKIIFCQLENDNTEPYVKITTVSGVIMKFRVNPSQTSKIINLIQNKRAKVLKEELKKSEVTRS